MYEHKEREREREDRGGRETGGERDGVTANQVETQVYLGSPK